MSQKIRLPNITAKTDREKLAQLESYLFQLAQQLNIILDEMQAGIDKAGGNAASGNGQNRR